MLPALPQEDLHVRITRLYFRFLLPMSGLAIALAALPATPTGKLVLVPLGLLSLVAGLLHWRIPQRYEETLRLIFAGVLVLFVTAVALLGLFTTLPGDGTQMSVLYLFAPVTVFAWGFLFFDQPRLGTALSLLLSISATVLLWRWNVQGIQPSVTSPPLLLFISLIVLYYNSLVLDLNRQFIDKRRESRQDALTGLMNRRAFEERPEHTPLAWDIAVLDVDYFKRVNDTYGHPAGDRVLRAVGDVLLDKLNGVGEAYRWGGEEFVVMRPQTAPQAFVPWLEGVRAEIASRAFVNEQHVTLSAGVSLHTPDKPLPTAFAEADQALLQAKRTGRNRIEVHPYASR